MDREAWQSTIQRVINKDLDTTEQLNTYSKQNEDTCMAIKVLISISGPVVGLVPTFFHHLLCIAFAFTLQVPQLVTALYLVTTFSFLKGASL